MKNALHEKRNSACFNTKKHLLFFVLLIFFGSMPFDVISQNSDEVIIEGVYAMPDVEPEGTAEKQMANDAVRVDLHRFMGFEILPSRYLSLPYDTYQHTNVSGTFNDVGFILLLLLPILFLFSGKGTKDPLTNFLFMGLCLLMLTISIPSSFMNHHGHNSIEESMIFLANNPAEGTIGHLSDMLTQVTLKIYSPIHELFTSFSGDKDSFTYPLLMVLFLSVLFLLSRRLSIYSKVTQSLIYFLAIYFFLWWILGTGAAWYGMLLFCIPFIFLIKGMATSEKINLKNLSPFLGMPGILLLSCLIWLFFAFSYRTSGYAPLDEEGGKFIYIPPFLEYQTGEIGEDKVTDMLFPNATEIKRILNQDEEALIYLVGVRQINFFVEKNDSRVFSDTFLGFFDQMVRRFKDKRKITQALRARGFKYIAFSLSLANIDQTPNKSLSRKFTNFVNTLYNNPDVELVLTDRTIRRNDGQLIYGVHPVGGTIEKSGTMAIYKIK